MCAPTWLEYEIYAIKVSNKILLPIPRYLYTFHDTKPHSGKIMVTFFCMLIKRLQLEIWVSSSYSIFAEMFA